MNDLTREYMYEWTVVPSSDAAKENLRLTRSVATFEQAAEIARDIASAIVQYDSDDQSYEAVVTLTQRNAIITLTTPVGRWASEDQRSLAHAITSITMAESEKYGIKETNLDTLDPETKAFAEAVIVRLRQRIKNDDFSYDPRVGEKQWGGPGESVDPTNHDKKQ